jgi:bifunctional UDP-N-acetylglucosamine pyrophosphorylase/glucosamine-1-phosphate N-acetyltransferase
VNSPRRSGRRRGAHSGAGTRPALEDGVTLTAPDTVHFAYDTVLGRDA